MNRVALLRKEAGMSQRDLASRLGVQASVVSKYENGSIKLSEDILRQLVIIFGGVSADFILGLSDDRRQGTSRAVPHVVWDTVELVEGADALSEENRAVLIGCVRDPRILTMMGQFRQLSRRSKRKLVDYMELLKIAEESGRLPKEEPEPSADPAAPDPGPGSAPASDSDEK